VQPTVVQLTLIDCFWFLIFKTIPPPEHRQMGVPFSLLIVNTFNHKIKFFNIRQSITFGIGPVEKQFHGKTP